MPSITEIAAAMLEQDNRGTQYPLFVVRHTTKVFVEGADYDGEQRKDGDLLDITTLCTSCLALREEGEVLPDECGECHIEAYDYYKNKAVIDTRAGYFFTEQACEQHILQNNYHYEKDAHSYVVSAWRNPELVAVMQNILTQHTPYKDLPNYYK